MRVAPMSTPVQFWGEVRCKNLVKVNGTRALNRLHSKIGILPRVFKSPLDHGEHEGNGLNDHFEYIGRYLAEPLVRYPVSVTRGLAEVLELVDSTSTH